MSIFQRCHLAATESAWPEKATQHPEADQFRHALEVAFGALDWLPIAGRAIHRFHAPHSKLGNHPAWYLLSVNGREDYFGSLNTDNALQLLLSSRLLVLEHG